MINILILTFNRAQMLRRALESVSAQTVCDQISTVLVSENGGNSESRRICAEFPQLPINYIFRDPPLSSLEHHRTVMKESLVGEFTAILHDDDWWAQQHLENGIASLRQYQQAVAYYCSFYHVTGESSLLSCGDNLYFWFGGGYPALNSIWELSKSQIILANLLSTTGHFSALIVRTESLRKASIVFDSGNDFDIDRMLTVELANHGSILYNPIPEVFIRRHENQDSSTFTDVRCLAFRCRTTDWIIKSAGQNPRELARLFVATVQKCPPQARHYIENCMRASWCLPRMAMNPEMSGELGALMPDPLVPVKKPSRFRLLRDSLKQITPPIIYRLMSAIKRRFGKR